MTEQAIRPADEVQALVVDTPRYLEVHNQADLDVASAFLRQVAQVKARIKEIFRPQISKAHELHKSLLAEEKKFTDELDEVDRKVREKVGAYIREQERLRFEAERKAAMDKAKIEKVSDAAVDKAHDLISEGRLDEADKVIEKAKEKVGQLSVAPPIPPKPEAAGIQVKKVWTFEIVNEDRIPAKFKKPDLVKIRAFVTEFKHEAWKHLPGVRVFQRDDVTVSNK